MSYNVGDVVCHFTGYVQNVQPDLIVVHGDRGDALAGAIQEDEELEVYTSGTTNILKYPELSDSQKARELLDAFEEKQQLISLVNETLTSQEETGIQVYIGSESPIQNMKDCSVVTATYQIGEGMTGTIGIIGPKRMDYENVMDNLKTLKVQLDTVFRKPKKSRKEIPRSDLENGG